MAEPRTSTAVDCPVCGKTISRKGDLPRHLGTHAANKEELMHDCPYVGCPYKALQRSNLMTHLNVHTGERPHKCPSEGCEFSSTDPGSLTRHRREIHGYQPKGNSGSHPPASTRRTARRRRRISPYTTSSSPSDSSSPLEASSNGSLSPHPPLPDIPEGFPSSSVLLGDDQVEEGSKNTSAAHSTELIMKRAQANDAHLGHPEKAPPLTSGSGVLTASEAPVAEQPQPFVPEQVDLYTFDAAAQLLSEMTVSDGMFVNFYAQFDDWLPDAAPVYTGPSLLTPVVQHGVDDGPLPTPESLSPGPYEVQYAVDNSPVLTQGSWTLPAYEVRYGVDNGLSSYEYDGYTTAAASFEAQFHFAQPDSFATTDMGMGVYAESEVVCPRAVVDVDESYLSYLYSTTSYCDASTSGDFSMQGLYA